MTLFIFSVVLEGKHLNDINSYYYFTYSLCYKFKTVLQTFSCFIFRKFWESSWNRIMIFMKTIISCNLFSWHRPYEKANMFMQVFRLSRILFCTFFISLLLTEKLTNMFHRQQNITRKIKKVIYILVSSVFKCHFKGSKYMFILS